MPEYIEREAAIKCCTFGRTSLGLISELRRIPAADVAPIRHGRWTKKWSEIWHEELPYCSECKKMTVYTFDYCPNCGARMDKEDDDGNT